MITLEVRVNGSIIAAATIVQQGPCEDGRHLYNARTIQFPLDHKDETKVRDFSIKHQREDGAMALMAIVSKEMMK